ncbi:uncharacterized protein A4U43_C01F25000 [Asparagus officinalis]|uniref:Uncharacterized protein n=1 Tax=Asparagus officinalis TaxID=4686 RepID=A0A5P1FW36_ASPOF|nr:uncharacterized protein A4U43_C01F25000 [Asparagus officinalis]
MMTPSFPSLLNLITTFKTHPQSQNQTLTLLRSSPFKPTKDLVCSALWELAMASATAIFFVLLHAPLFASWARNFVEDWPKAWELMIWVMGNEKRFNLAWSLVHRMHRKSLLTAETMVVLMDRFPGNDFDYNAKSLPIMAHWTEKRCASRENYENLFGRADNKMYHELQKKLVVVFDLAMPYMQQETTDASEGHHATTSNQKGVSSRALRDVDEVSNGDESSQDDLLLDESPFSEHTEELVTTALGGLCNHTATSSSESPPSETCNGLSRTKLASSAGLIMYPSKETSLPDNDRIDEKCSRGLRFQQTSRESGDLQMEANMKLLSLSLPSGTFDIGLIVTRLMISNMSRDQKLNLYDFWVAI